MMTIAHSITISCKKLGKPGDKETVELSGTVRAMFGMKGKVSS